MAAVVNARIRPDQVEELKRRGDSFNFSKFVRDKLDEEFENVDIITEKENKLLQELEVLKNRKEIVKNKKPKEKESSTEKEKFFREARIKIKENPDFLLGQWEKYKNIFEKITLEKFKEMINEKQKS